MYGALPLTRLDGRNCNMETERLIRILQRFQKPEGDREKMPLYDLCLFGSGLQKAIDTIKKLRSREMQEIINQYQQADSSEKRRLSRINAALIACAETFKV